MARVPKDNRTIILVRLVLANLLLFLMETTLLVFPIMVDSRSSYNVFVNDDDDTKIVRVDKTNQAMSQQGFD